MEKTLEQNVKEYRTAMQLPREHTRQVQKPRIHQS